MAATLLISVTRPGLLPDMCTSRMLLTRFGQPDRSPERGVGRPQNAQKAQEERSKAGASSVNKRFSARFVTSETLSEKGMRCGHPP